MAAMQRPHWECQMPTATFVLISRLGKRNYSNTQLGGGEITRASTGMGVGFGGWLSVVGPCQICATQVYIHYLWQA